MATNQASRLPIDVAHVLADKIVRELSPSCVRVEVVGSVRRRKREVGDIEVLAVPRLRPGLIPGVAGAGTSELEDRLRELQVAGRLVTPAVRNGPLWKTFELAKWPGVRLDVFVLPEERADSWGMNQAIRTGPADFSAALVAYQGTRGKGGVRGLLPPDLLVRDGFVLWRLLGGQHDEARKPDRAGDDLRYFDDADEDPMTGEAIGCWCVRVPTPTEADVFEAYGLDFVPPEARA